MRKIYILSLACALGIVSSIAEAHEYVKFIRTTRTEKDIRAAAVFEKLPDNDKQIINSAAKLANALTGQYFWKVKGDILVGRSISSSTTFSDTYDALKKLPVEERRKITFRLRSKTSIADPNALDNLAIIMQSPDQTNFLNQYGNLFKSIYPEYIRMPLSLTDEAHQSIKTSEVHPIDLIRMRASTLRKQL